MPTATDRRGISCSSPVWCGRRSGSSPKGDPRPEEDGRLVVDLAGIRRRRLECSGCLARCAGYDELALRRWRKELFAKLWLHVQSLGAPLLGSMVLVCDPLQTQAAAGLRVDAAPHQDGILAYFDVRIDNGAVEAMNNNAKAVNHRHVDFARHERSRSRNLTASASFNYRKPPTDSR